jgi:hypothetical protein
MTRRPPSIEMAAASSASRAGSASSAASVRSTELNGSARSLTTVLSSFSVRSCTRPESGPKTSAAASAFGGAATNLSAS